MAVLTRLVMVVLVVATNGVDLSDDIYVTTEVGQITGQPIYAWNVLCRVRNPSGDKISRITIDKTPSNPEVNQPLAQVNSVDDAPRVDPSLQQRANATGTVNLAAGPFLKLSVVGPTLCSDGGEYVCEVIFENAGAKRSTITPTTFRYPGSMEMWVEPRQVAYNVSDTVELVCSGVMGKPVARTWVWEARDNTAGSNWTQLRAGLAPVKQAYVTSGECVTTRNSTLRVSVLMEDHKRTYRCSFADVQYSANFTINVIGASTTVNADNGSTPAARLSTGTTLAISVVLTFLLLWQ